MEIECHYCYNIIMKGLIVEYPSTMCSFCFYKDSGTNFYMKEEDIKDYNKKRYELELERYFQGKTL